MTDRGMTASMLAEIAKADTYPIDLVYIDTSPVLRITTAHKSLTYASQTWSPLGQLLSVPDIEETLGIQSAVSSLRLSGVDQSIISAVLSQKLINRDVQIFLGFLDSAGALVPDPVQIYKGKVSGWNVREDVTQESSVVEVQLSSHWVDFEKTAGRRTNDRDQQLLHLGDDGFRHSSEIIKDLQWG